ncbi:bifunctional lysine-specific demethylase and histidyl-hydroxylase NO66-like isoform X2 [Glandiceps talaboti]
MKDKSSRVKLRSSGTPTTGITNGNSRVREKEDEDDGSEQRPVKRRKMNDHKKSPKKEAKSPSKEMMTPSEFLNEIVQFEDSAVEADKLFEWLINPVKPSTFFSNLWEKKPLLVKRHSSSYNTGWFSTEELDRIVRENELEFSKNIDVTTYTDGKRETHNPVGRVHAPVLWDYYQNGCSVRMLNPQTYCKPLWKLNSTLQEYFGSCVGANIYLTPPGSQGFAPHYDDIEAFVIQLEGKKHWRLYSPRTDEENLPRFSSGNFQDEDIGNPILDIVLEAGDLLYFPRGTIHQADTPSDSHSLHITLSTCQKNTWGDLMEKLVPRALQVAFEEDLDFRQSLPRDYLNYMGVANSDSDDPKRAAFLNKVGQLMMKLVSYAPVDSAADQMAIGYVHDCLPPLLTQDEKSRCIFGSGAKWKDGKVSNEVQLEDDSEIKIIRRGVIRLVAEDEKVMVYYTLDNSRQYHEKDPQFIEIPAEAAPAVEYLLSSYPGYVRVASLPLEEMTDKHVEVAQLLYERGIVVTKEALKPVL